MLKIRARGEVLQLRDEDELILHVEELFAGFGDFWPPTRIDLRQITDIGRWSREPGNLYCGRARRANGETLDEGLGNPFKIGRYTRMEVVELHRKNIIPHMMPELVAKVKQARAFGCFCDVHEQCHTDNFMML